MSIATNTIYTLKISSFQLKAFELALIKLKLIIKVFLNENVLIGNLPSDIRKHTILKSPHVDKKARDQLEQKKYNKILQLNLPESKVILLNQLYSFLLRNNILTDVEIKIKKNKKIPLILKK